MGRRYWVLDHCFFLFSFFFCRRQSLHSFMEIPQSWTKTEQSRIKTQENTTECGFRPLISVSETCWKALVYSDKICLPIQTRCFTLLFVCTLSRFLFVSFCSTCRFPRFPCFISLLLWLLLHKTWANLEFAHLKYMYLFACSTLCYFKYSCDQQTFIWSIQHLQRWADTTCFFSFLFLFWIYGQRSVDTFLQWNRFILIINK